MYRPTQTEKIKISLEGAEIFLGIDNIPWQNIKKDQEEQVISEYEFSMKYA